MNERLDGVERTLTTLTEHVKEQFTQIDQRFTQIDQRFAQVDQRFAQVDQRFAQVDQRFVQVDQRFAQVDQRFAQVDERFETLTKEVQKLRVLGEEDAARIQIIADVQAHHGSVHGAALERIEAAIEPLKGLPAALEQILPDYERRISALEKAGSTNRSTL
jgi:chromosome segregation ATPase